MNDVLTSEVSTPTIDTLNETEIEAGLAPTPGYRYAERAGGQLFIAGQVPLDHNGDLIGAGDPAAQATACLDNLDTLLDVHDFTVDAVRQLVVYVVGEHQNLLDAWTAVREWFADCVPPATLLGVHLLGHPGQLVEIDATVIRNTAGDGRHRAATPDPES